MNLGAFILDGAIKLSLEYLDTKLATMPDVSSAYSVYELYVSLCVLEKQQWIPTSVLAQMWGMDDESARSIAELFSSMSLGRLAVQATDEEPAEVGISVHDLHQEFCREQAQVSFDKKKMALSSSDGSFARVNLFGT